MDGADNMGIPTVYGFPFRSFSSFRFIFPLVFFILYRSLFHIWFLAYTGIWECSFSLLLYALV
jgi:hypothetical protein